MEELYRKLKFMWDKLLLTPTWLIVRSLEMLYRRMNKDKKQQNERMWNTELDYVPFVSYNSVQGSMPGRYCVSQGIRYRCVSSGIKLITLYLPKFQRKDRIITPGEDIYIPPFTAHLFLAESTDSKSSGITRISESPWNYTFDIEVDFEYSVVPNDFRLDQQRMRIAETVLKIAAAQGTNKGLIYDKYSLFLRAVLNISRFLKLSGFEHALLLGMAFNLLQRCSPSKDRIANIAYGAYQRVYSSLGSGFHDVRTTEIGCNAGPIIYTIHRSHFTNEIDNSLPRISIGKNVLIGYPTFIEVGTGLSIKEFTWIAEGVSFLKHEQSPEGGGQLSRTVDYTSHYPTEIGPYAMIGQSARILPKAFYIGKGATIGHSTIVTRSVGDYAIVAGNPGELSGTM